MSQARPVLAIRCACALMALAAVLALGAAPAVAIQGPWLAPVDLSAADQTAGAPQLAFAPDGTTTATWTAPSGGVHEIVQVSTRPPGGVFGSPVDLSATGQNASTPQLAVAADGTTIAIWSRYELAGGIVQTSTRPPGGAFGPAVNLSVAGLEAVTPQIAVAADGTATAVWRRDDGSNHVIQASTRPVGGVFGAPVNLSATGQDATAPQIAVAADGTTTAVWQRNNGSNEIVQASIRPPGGAFGPPVDLSVTTQDALAPQLAVAADGTTTAIWSRNNGANYVIQASTRPAGGSFSAPVNLSVAGASAETPQLTIAADGSTTVVWSRSDGVNDRAQASTRPAGGAFAAPVDLSAAGSGARDPQVATAADGSTTAIWRRFDGATYIVQSSTRPAGGSFGPSVNLSPLGGNPVFAQIDAGLDGTATVIWANSIGANRIIQAASTANPPVSRRVPVISGATAVGATLACSDGGWSGAATIATSWLRGATQVGTGLTYTVVTTDQGAALVCRQRGTNPFGSAETTSLPTSIPVPPAPAIDRTQPTLTVLTKTRLTRRQFRNGVSVRVSSDEPTTIVADLLARAKGARISAVPFNLTLGARTVRGVTNSVTIKIKPNRALVGKARVFSVRLRLTATDASGNQRVTGKTIRVAGR